MEVLTLLGQLSQIRRVTDQTEERTVMDRIG